MNPAEYERGLLDALELFKSMAVEQRRQLAHIDGPFSVDVFTGAITTLTTALLVAFERRVFEHLIAKRGQQPPPTA